MCTENILFSEQHDLDSRSKVLIVTSRFPGGGGSRIDAFVKYLPRYQVDPLVLSSDEDYDSCEEPIGRKSYSPQFKLFRASSIGRTYFTKRFMYRGPESNHYRLLNILSFPERFILVPDDMVRWIPHGIKVAKDIISREGVNVILTTSPPESTHLIGLFVNRSLGIPWIVDFQDLWTEKVLHYRPATPIHDWWIKRLESKIFKAADRVIANTSENAERHKRRFALTSKCVEVIPNGFDPDDLYPDVDQSLPDVFCIGYMGALDKHDFPWRITLDAINKLGNEVGRANVKFIFCGYPSRQVIKYLQDRELTDIIDIRGLQPHSEAMRIISSTDIRILLLYETPYSSSIVPQKLYNYLIMKGPILAVAPEVGMTASIIAETRMGIVVPPRRGSDAIYQELKRYYLAWQRGDLNVHPNQNAIDQYSYCANTQRLAKLIQGVVKCDS